MKHEIENELRNPNGSGTLVANQLTADAQVFAQTMLRKYGSTLSADAIAFCIISATHGECAMAITMEAIEKPK